MTPRGPNLKLRKRYQQMQNQEEEFDKLTSTPKRMKLDSEDEDGLEDLDLENEEDMGTKTIQVGDKNFTFSFS